jgi:hypothetical protein
MGLKDIFKRPQETAEEPQLGDIEQPSWAAQSVHRAVAELPAEKQPQAVSTTASRLKDVIDEVLREQGDAAVSDPALREDLSARAQELEKMAQQPELPPDGDNPAA